MLHYALIVATAALIVGLFGFVGLAGASAGLSQILFYLFLAFLVGSLAVGLIRRV